MHCPLHHPRQANLTDDKRRTLVIGHLVEVRMPTDSEIGSVGILLVCRVVVLAISDQRILFNSIVVGVQTRCEV